MRETKPSKWLRLLDIIHRIAAEPGRTSQELADDMGCTPRTIFRDISALESLGFPIYNDSGYRFATDAFLPPINLEPRELFSLFLGGRLLESQGGEALVPDVRRALEKLLRATSSSRRPHLGEMRESLQVAEPSEDTGMDQLLALQSVIGNGRQLRISYLGLQDEHARARVVDPMGLFGFRQVWYLRAYDLLRSDYRSFRLSRIVDWEMLETPVSQPARMELQEAVYHRWDVEGGQSVLVEMRVTEALGRWLSENPPHPSQTLDEGRVTYLVSDLPAVARWTASLHGVEVLAPAALRQEMSRLATDMQSLYLAEAGSPKTLSNARLNVNV